MGSGGDGLLPKSVKIKKPDRFLDLRPAGEK